MELEWITPEEAGINWGIKARRVQDLCSSGQVSGAVRFGRVWLIPKNTKKPIDGRTRAAKKFKNRQGEGEIDKHGKKPGHS